MVLDLVVEQVLVSVQILWMLFGILFEYLAQLVDFVVVDVDL